MTHSYRSLRDYLTSRCASFNISMRELSRTLGFSSSYIEMIANGYFNPSRKRCLKIAQHFNDDPNIVLELAGLYVPSPSTGDPLRKALDSMASNLPAPELRQLLVMARLLKLQADQRLSRVAESGASYVISPADQLRELLDLLPADVAPTAHQLLDAVEKGSLK